MINTKLLKYEISCHIKSNSTIRYLLLFFVFCTLSLVLITSHHSVGQFGILFTIIAIPLALINLSKLILKEDVGDGTLENLLTVFSGLEIVIAKLISLFLCVVVAFLINLLIVYFVFDVPPYLVVVLLLSGIILCASSSALMCLISAIEGYFRSNTHFISILVMPLMIPSIILSGLAISSATDSSATESVAMVVFISNPYIWILLGVCLITSPVCILLSKYLVENIYNI